MKKLELGISNFKKFIDEDCYFVDKSGLIGWMIDHPSEIHLITRPRRFGKTLNLSMIRYFLEAPTQNIDHHSPLTTPTSIPNSYLFKDLKITTHPRCAEFMGQHPVIHLSFKSVKINTFESCIRLLKKSLIAECERHSYILNFDFMTPKNKEYYNSILSGEAPDDEYTSIIADLSSWLHQAYGKPVYILLDEYDTPLHSAYSNNYYEKMITFIRSFMVQTFKDNPHLKQAVVIGILKIAQESIFSDFNNPRVSTLMDPEIEDAFGFTESEVQAMVEHFELESQMGGIKEWYDGYLFGGHTVIYNPWSIVNFLSRPDAGFKPHWVNTSDNKLIQDVIKLNYRDAIITTEKLLNKEKVRKSILTNIPYMQVGNDPDVIWSFLLHSGYLKAEDMHQEELGTSWRISIPNKEVKIAWITVVQNWLKQDIAVNEHFTDFVNGIRDSRPRCIEDGLAGILFGLSSYHDTVSHSERAGENFYHGLVLGLLASLGSLYTIDSNREYGEGRPDIVVVKKGSDPARAEEAFIFEFKHGKSAAKSALDKLAREAFSQADEQYLAGVQDKWNPKRLQVFGIGFSGKKLAVLYDEV